MVVEDGGALVKAPRVPGVAIAEALVIEMMAKLVAQGAEKRSERCDLFAHRGLHPNANQLGSGIVIAEKLDGPAAFPRTDRPRCENACSRRFNLVEARKGVQKFGAGVVNRGNRSRGQRGLDCLGRNLDAFVLRQAEGPVLVASEEVGEQRRFARSPVGDHG